MKCVKWKGQRTKIGLIPNYNKQITLPNIIGKKFGTLIVQPT